MLLIFGSMLFGVTISSCSDDDENKKTGIYDGAYKVVELAIAMKAGTSKD